MKEKSELQKIKDALNGTEGLIYIMLCGKNAYALKISKPLLDAGIFEHKESVTQALNRLLTKKEDSLQYITTLEAPGNPKVYTANLQLLYMLLRSMKLDFNEAELELAIKQLSELNDYFPKVFVESEKQENGSITYDKIRWNDTLADYFFFLWFNLVNAGRLWCKVTGPNFAERALENLPKDMEPIRPIIQEFFGHIENLPHINFDITKIEGISPETFVFLYKAALALSAEGTFLARMRGVFFKAMNSQFEGLRKAYQEILENKEKYAKSLSDP